MTVFTIEPAARVPWTAVEQVFASTGESSHCWCRWWLTTNAEYSALDDDARRDATKAEHAAETVRGLIALRDGAPVGWVGVGPRADYVRLARTKVIAGAWPDDDRDAHVSDPAVWSVHCLIVSPHHRGAGVARALLAAAVEHAIRSGATTLEAYPIDTGSTTARALRPTYLNTGTAALFSAAGFSEVGTRVKPSRPVMRLALGGRS